MGGFGSFNIRPPHPNDPVVIDLTPTPIPAANLRIHTRRKKNDHRKGSIYNFATANQSYALLMTSKSFLWKSGGHFTLLLCHNEVVIRLSVHCGMYLFLFSPFLNNLIKCCVHIIYTIVICDSTYIMKIMKGLQ